jgi:hypothetical protein
MGQVDSKRISKGFIHLFPTAARGPKQAFSHENILMNPVEKLFGWRNPTDRKIPDSNILLYIRPTLSIPPCLSFYFSSFLKIKTL